MDIKYWLRSATRSQISWEIVKLFSLASLYKNIWLKDVTIDLSELSITETWVCVELKSINYLWF